MKKLTWVHLLLIFLSAKLALHLYVNGRWSFHRDELLYLALGRHLDWGFASVPPAIGFWAWFGESFLGGSVEAIRLLATVFGTATVLLIAMMAKEMLPKSEGKFAVTLVGLSGLLCGASLRTSMLFMPVVFDIFYWTLLCWLFLNTSIPKNQAGCSISAQPQVWDCSTNTAYSFSCSRCCLDCCSVPNERYF
jgi:hypothetical protein